MHCKLLTLFMDGEKLILDESRHPVILDYKNNYNVYISLYCFIIYCAFIRISLFNEIILALVIHE
jgi:hypothetical protein